MTPPSPDDRADHDDEPAYQARLEQMIGELPTALLNNLQILLTGCVQATLALWREPGVSAATIAEAEALSGLTQERVRAMSQALTPEAVGRLLLTAPVRLHALTALGLALLDTPLLDRFTAFMTRPGSDFEPDAWPRIRDASRDIGTKLMTQFEDRADGAIFDIEDLLAERRGELPDAPRYDGEQLRLRRLQLEGFVARSLADYAPPDAAAPPPLTATLLTPATDPGAPDAPEAADEAFQESFLQIRFLEPQIAMLQLAVRLPLALRLLVQHRFGEAARTLRWLRDPKPLYQLLRKVQRFAPEEEVELTAADVLRLYQGAQYAALALVGDVMHDLDDLLATSSKQDRESLSAFFDAPPDADGESPRRAIFGMVQGFVEMVREVVTPDVVAVYAALQTAQAEIDELGNLV